MPDLNNREYYAARAAKALELSRTATDPEVAAIHRKMADTYTELVELTEPQPQILQFIIK